MSVRPAPQTLAQKLLQRREFGVTQRRWRVEKEVHRERPVAEHAADVVVATAVGDGLALARVKKGEEEIYTAFQKGEKLYCFDRPEWLIDGNYKWQLKKAGF